MIFLGKILKIRGNRGEVVLDPSSEFFNHELPDGIELVLKSPKYKKNLKIKSCREIGGSWMVQFSGVNSINDALRLVGYSLYLEEGVSPAQLDPENNVVGFRVEDFRGESWGIIVKVVHHGINAVLEVEYDGDTILIPMGPAIIRAVVIGEKKVVIDPPPGLKDLNR